MQQESKAEKGGHMPAEKIAGGVRIVKKTRVSSESEKNTNSKTPGTTVPPEAVDELALMEESKNILAHSGLAAQTKKDYPAEAIRAYHEKPLPQHQKPTQKPATIVFQPTKQ